MIKEAYKELAERLLKEIEQYYGPNLVSVVIFGSVAAGTMRADSDIDILICAQQLPHGRWARAKQFEQIEDGLAESMARLA